MERAELKQEFGSDFAKPAARVFYCPMCNTNKTKIALVMKVFCLLLQESLESWKDYSSLIIFLASFEVTENRKVVV